MSLNRIAIGMYWVTATEDCRAEAHNHVAFAAGVTNYQMWHPSGKHRHLIDSFVI